MLSNLLVRNNNISNKPLTASFKILIFIVSIGEYLREVKLMPGVI